MSLQHHQRSFNSKTEVYFGGTHNPRFDSGSTNLTSIDAITRDFNRINALKYNSELPPDMKFVPPMKSNLNSLWTDFVQKHLSKKRTCYDVAKISKHSEAFLISAMMHDADNSDNSNRRKKLVPLDKIISFTKCYSYNKTTSTKRKVTVKQRICKDCLARLNLSNTFRGKLLADDSYCGPYPPKIVLGEKIDGEIYDFTIDPNKESDLK